MTVEELIQTLESLSAPNAKVWMDIVHPDHHGGSWEINTITTSSEFGEVEVSLTNEEVSDD